MKVLTKILGVIILLGLALSVAAFFMGLDITNLRGFFTDEEAYGEMQTETTDQIISKLVFDVDTRNIVIHYVDQENLSLTYYEHESKDTWTFETSGSIYTVTQKEKAQWFFFNYKYTPQDIKTIHVYLPEAWALDYDLKTSVGDIKIENETVKTAGDVKLYSNTGSIYVELMDCDILDLKTDTGSIHVNEINVLGDLNLDSDTGSIILNTVTGEDYVLSTNTGSLQLTDVEGSELSVSVDTGRVTLTNSTFTGAIIVDSSTGDMIINETLGSSFDINSSTGDVKMTFSDLSNYRYDLRTDTGNIKIEGNDQGNRHSTSTGSILIKVDVNTGNIRINS